MKKTVLVLIGLILISGIDFAIDTGFSLACFSTETFHNSKSPVKRAIFENQMKPINEAFHLNADLSGLKKVANMDTYANTGYTGWGTYIFGAKISISMPRNGVKYEIIRNGKTVSSQSTTIQQGDIIRFKPEINVGNDWITQDWIIEGANIDSPPITMLNRDTFEDLYNTLGIKFEQKYPVSNRGRALGYVNAFSNSDGKNVSVPKFSTQTTEFKETGNYYIADNGYPAYLVPSIGGQKAGIQIFYTPNLNTENTNCKTTGDTIECKITQSQNLKLNFSGKSFVHVDKIINGNKAINAKWVTGYGNTAIQSSGVRPNPYYNQDLDIDFQILLPGKQAPIADFDCKATEEDYYDWRGEDIKIETLECNASKSRAPDGGTIQEYDWDNSPSFYPEGHKKTYKKQWQRPKQIHGSKPITVTLKVTDNDGYYGEKTKTFQFSPDGEITNNFKLSATHKPSTKMAEITTDCEGIVTLTIKNKITGEAEIEKAEIPCGQTSEIGPFIVEGAYNAIGENNGQTREAIFTVD